MNISGSRSRLNLGHPHCSSKKIYLHLRQDEIYFRIRYSRIANGTMADSLKPQDVLVLLKLVGYKDARPPYSAIASDIGVSQSEINASVKRLQSAKLLHPSSRSRTGNPDLSEIPILDAVEEFLIHGVKYAFPASHGTIVRGMPTSYAADPLRKLIAVGDDPIPVWPDPNGDTRGLALIPLYRSIPDAAKKDIELYARLALVDAIRAGGARQRKLAEKELRKSLRNNGGH